jgi:DinB family
MAGEKPRPVSTAAGRQCIFPATMPADLRETILNTWRTCNRLTVFLVERIPPKLWASAIPGAPRRTIRMMAGHIHNSRWIKTLGEEFGVTVPRSVDRHRVDRRTLVSALGKSSQGMLDLLALGCDRGGSIPPASTYTWRNLPLDVGHVLAYFVAHEAHHRGQIVVVDRALGHRLPAEVTDGLWQWNHRAAEAGAAQR